VEALGAHSRKETPVLVKLTPPNKKEDVDRTEMWKRVIFNRVSHAVLYEYKTNPAIVGGQYTLPSVVSSHVAPVGAFAELVAASGNVGYTIAAAPRLDSTGEPVRASQSGARVLSGGRGMAGPAAAPSPAATPSPVMPGRGQAAGVGRTDFVVLFVWKEP
jgi:hypothetical protein